MDVMGNAGVRLRVWDYGGSGPPLLFCHCAGTMGRIWDPVIGGLSGNARIFSMDLRGHGDSDKPQGAEYYRWERMGADVAAVAEYLGLNGSAAAVGHSGGGVAVTLAQLAHPGLFAKIVLVDAIVAPASFFPAVNPMAALARRRKGNFPSRGAVRERLGGKLPYNAWSAAAFDAYVTHGFFEMPDGTVQIKCPGPIEARFYEAGPTEYVLERMGSLAVPVLFMTGTESYMLEHVREQHRRTAGSRLEILGGAGHFIPQERPAQTADLIGAWLR